ncbi:hypothetical protein ABZ656_13015 [Streptomyces sp. NPDC007095]|uniref:hypothetical protein n=1 Tax=Streptomyces sp. NPDC007095 TaxID=3154482 RepID=UPI003411C82E
MPFEFVTADAGDLHRVLGDHARLLGPLCSSSREIGLRRGGVPGGVCSLRSVELKEEETRAHAALPPLQRAFLAWHLDGFATSEISDAPDMTHEAVRQNLSRGRGRLKTILPSVNDGGGR